MVRLHKNGNCFGIETDCKDKADFLEQFSSLLGLMADERCYEGDWPFQLEGWLPIFSEIYSKESPKGIASVGEINFPVSEVVSTENGMKYRFPKN